MNNGLIGIRIGRNSPVLFVSADRDDRSAGDRVIVVLSIDDTVEHEASVVVSTDQLLGEPDVTPAGRIIRSA